MASGLHGRRLAPSAKPNPAQRWLSSGSSNNLRFSACTTRCRAAAAEAAPEPVSSHAHASMDADASPGANNVRIIGIGARGISAMKRLSGSSCAQDIQLWAVDSDKKVLAGTQGLPVSLVELQQSDDSTLSPSDLQRLAGDVQPQATKDAASNHQGIAFVLGSAFGSPGGATLMLQLVNHLRRCGYFVAVALTRPFTFEGVRKLEQADALIEAMEDVAAMVVVIDQNVLTRASSELTMSEASAIADNTLEYTVRSLMWALHAPEVLKVTRGAFQWHGRDLRLLKHPMFPPMMHLITCPGVGNLGRGQASVPLASLQHAKLPSALSTLAEDAVKAAAESPFLESKVSSGTAILCVLLLPRCLMDLGAMGRYVPGLTDHQREYALRSAIQVAAMTVQELAGPQCTDIIICPQVREEEETGALPAGGEEPGMLRLECAMLALQAIDEAASPAGAAPKEQPDAAAPSSTPEVPNTPMSRLGLSDRSRSRPTPTVGTSLTSSTDRVGAGRTGGGSAGGAGQPGPASWASGGSIGIKQPPLAGQGAGGAARGGVRSVRSKTNWNAMSLIAGGSSAAAPQDAGARAARPRVEREAPSQELPGRPQRPTQPPNQPSAAPSRLGTRFSSPQANAGDALSAGSRDSAPARGQSAPERIPRMPDNLVTSLVAQSLDLPPGAAKWRHQQRKAAAAFKPRSNAFQLPETSVASPDSDDEKEMPRRSLDVRARVVGMLEKEREF